VANINLRSGQNQDNAPSADYALNVMYDGSCAMARKKSSIWSRTCRLSRQTLSSRRSFDRCFGQQESVGGKMVAPYLSPIFLPFSRLMTKIAIKPCAAKRAVRWLICARGMQFVRERQN
jgi:hypothetical protein